MATMLGERKGGRVSLSAVSLRTLLDGIATRLDESREISRYLIGLLVFLGLLGTFYGLLETLRSVGGVINGLTIGTNDVARAFNDLKTGLQAPLSGMGTAFSASLFGLAGSLVLGFLDLQAGQAQNRFYNDLEEWLSSYTRLSSGGPLSEAGDASVPAYIQALLEQTADSLDNLQRITGRGEESRMAANASIVTLTDRLGMLGDQMKAEQNLMLRLAESQMELKPVLARLAEGAARRAATTRRCAAICAISRSRSPASPRSWRRVAPRRSRRCAARSASSPAPSRRLPKKPTASASSWLSPAAPAAPSSISGRPSSMRWASSSSPSSSCC